MIDRAWQIEFVRQLAQTIAGSMIEDIESGRVPDRWDGRQLKQLFADRADRLTYKMDRKERMEYNNTVLVENL